MPWNLQNPFQNFLLSLFVNLFTIRYSCSSHGTHCIFSYQTLQCTLLYWSSNLWILNCAWHTDKRTDSNVALLLIAVIVPQQHSHAQPSYTQHAKLRPTLLSGHFPETHPTSCATRLGPGVPNYYRIKVKCKTPNETQLFLYFKSVAWFIYHLCTNLWKRNIQFLNF